MGGVKNLFHFYVQASIHVAFATVALAQLTIDVFQIEVPNWLWLFVFSSTLVAYNFIKFFEKFRHSSMSIVRERLRFILLVTVIFALVGFYLFFQLNLLAKLIVIVTSIWVVLYNQPLLPQMKNFRSYSGIKIYIVALNWVLICVVFPFTYATEIDWISMMTMSILIFCYVFVATLPFELRDKFSDHPDLNTLPQKFGNKRVKWIGVTVLLGMFFLVFTRSTFSSEFIWASSLSFLLLLLLLWISQERQPQYFSSFWVEGIPLIWWGVFNFLSLCF